MASAALFSRLGHAHRVLCCQQWPRSVPSQETDCASKRYAKRLGDSAVGLDRHHCLPGRDSSLRRHPLKQLHCAVLVFKASESACAGQRPQQIVLQSGFHAECAALQPHQVSYTAEQRTLLQSLITCRMCWIQRLCREGAGKLIAMPYCGALTCTGLCRTYDFLSIAAWLF